MMKLVAIANVIAWAGFWSFGYIALTSDIGETGQMVTAAVLAAMGGGTGMIAYLWLIRHSEQSGYAKTPNRAVKYEDDIMDDHGVLRGEV